MAFLLTFHGTLLCRGPHGLTQRPPDARGNATAIQVDMAWHRMRGDFDRIVRLDRSFLAVAVPVGDLAGFTVHVEPDRRSVLLSQSGRYLSA